MNWFNSIQGRNLDQKFCEEKIDILNKKNIRPPRQEFFLQCNKISYEIRLVSFGLFLWHNNHCRLFIAKSYLYIYIRYISFVIIL